VISTFLFPCFTSLALFLLSKNVVIDENMQLKEQIEVIGANEVCSDFSFAVALVVLSNNFFTSSHLLCVYA